MKQIKLEFSYNESKVRITKALENSETMLLRRFNNRSFYIHSKKNYGSFSMIEKQYYTIKGKLKEEDQTSIVDYKVSANSTYRTMLYVIPLMLLPTIIFSLIGDRFNIWTGVGLFFLIYGVVAFLLHRIDRKLRKEGERDFETMCVEIV